MQEILRSSRFQALLIIAMIQLLGNYGYVNPEIVISFTTVLGGHIGIRTIDRASEKIGK